MVVFLEFYQSIKIDVEKDEKNSSYLGLIDPADLDITVNGDPNQRPDTVHDEEEEYRITDVSIESSKVEIALKLGVDDGQAVSQKEEDKQTDIIDCLGNKVTPC